MNIEDLLWTPLATDRSVLPEIDPLVEDDMLMETQLLDAHVSHVGSVAALLIEFRTGLQFDDGNTALLVVRGMREYLWHSSSVAQSLLAWTILGSEPRVSQNTFRLDLSFYPDATLRLEGSSAEFYVLEVPGISDAPPDYTNQDFPGVSDSLPRWSSLCSVLQSTFR